MPRSTQLILPWTRWRKCSRSWAHAKVKPNQQLATRGTLCRASTHIKIFYTFINGSTISSQSPPALPRDERREKEMNMPLAMLLLYVTTLTSPNPSIEGVKIVTRQITAGFTDTRTEYLAPDRLRNEWQSQMRDGSGPPMATIILRGERDRVFMLDLAAHEYVTYETDPRGSTVAMKRPMVDSGGTLQIWIENVDTGERKDLFGHTARHIITREKRVAGPGACSKPSLSETDGWYIDGSVMPQWRQQKKNSYGVVVAAEVSAGSNDKCFNKMDKIEVHRSGV